MSHFSQSSGVPRWWWWTAFAGLPLTALLPVAGYWARRGQQARCATDGQRIESVFLVQFVDGDGSRRDFCCLRCAQLWLARSKTPPAKILVTDEIDGQLLDAKDAFFVRSTVLSNGPTGDRRHVFRTHSQAQEHLETFRGRILTGTEHPFAELEHSPSESSP